MPKRQALTVGPLFSSFLPIETSAVPTRYPLLAICGTLLYQGQPSQPPPAFRWTPTPVKARLKTSKRRPILPLHMHMAQSCLQQMRNICKASRRMWPPFRILTDDLKMRGNEVNISGATVCCFPANWLELRSISLHISSEEVMCPRLSHIIPSFLNSLIPFGREMRY
jgi:hypothetical protein